MSRPVLLLSIRPEFAGGIFAGRKTVELRRVRPRVSRGDLVIVYATSPLKAVVGHFDVGGVFEETPTALWDKVAGNAGITHEQFSSYYEGARSAFGISIENPREFREGLGLSFLRQELQGFHPPQSYHYLDPSQAEKILSFVKPQVC